MQNCVLHPGSIRQTLPLLERHHRSALKLVASAVIYIQSSGLDLLTVSLLISKVVQLLELLSSTIRQDIADGG